MGSSQWKARVAHKSPTRLTTNANNEGRATYANHFQPIMTTSVILLKTEAPKRAPRARHAKRRPEPRASTRPTRQPRHMRRARPCVSGAALRGRSLAWRAQSRARRRPRARGGRRGTPARRAARAARRARGHCGAVCAGRVLNRDRCRGALRVATAFWQLGVVARVYRCAVLCWTVLYCAVQRFCRTL